MHVYLFVTFLISVTITIAGFVQSDRSDIGNITWLIQVSRTIKRIFCESNSPWLTRTHHCVKRELTTNSPNVSIAHCTEGWSYTFAKSRIMCRVYYWFKPSLKSPEGVVWDKVHILLTWEISNLAWFDWHENLLTIRIHCYI